MLQKILPLPVNVVPLTQHVVSNIYGDSLIIKNEYRSPGFMVFNSIVGFHVSRCSGNRLK